MNQQGPNGVEWCHVFGPGSGYTSNPVRGCPHECRWEMADGTIAICYAENIATGLARSAYPQGFAATQWHPEEMDSWIRARDPRGIFLDSMSDLMANQVPEEHIRQVLEKVAEADWHIFFLLTKNAPRLLKFRELLPPNLWVGCSMPPTFMFGKRLSENQQAAMLRRSLEVLDRIDVPVRWMSFEPLSFNVYEALMPDTPFPINWAVIGAASRGRETFQPNPKHVRDLLAVLAEEDCPVFFKGNLEWLPWMEEFPVTAQTPRREMQQMRMF